MTKLKGVLRYLDNEGQWLLEKGDCTIDVTDLIQSIAEHEHQGNLKFEDSVDEGNVEIEIRFKINEE